MRDPEYLDRLDADLEQLLRVANALPHALMAAKHDAAGIRAQAYDRPVVGGHGVSDPTGSQALAPGKVDQAVQQIHHALNTLHGVVEPLVWHVAWLTRSPMNHKQAREREENRKALADENAHVCRSCARTDIAPGVKRSVSAYRRTDAAGVLPEVIPLCSWCYRYAHDFGELPTVEQVEGHHSGKRTRRSA